MVYKMDMHLIRPPRQYFLLSTMHKVKPQTRNPTDPPPRLPSNCQRLPRFLRWPKSLYMHMLCCLQCFILTLMIQRRSLERMYVCPQTAVLFVILTCTKQFSIVHSNVLIRMPLLQKQIHMLLHSFKNVLEIPNGVYFQLDYPSVDSDSQNVAQKINPKIIQEEQAQLTFW